MAAHDVVWPSLPLKTDMIPVCPCTELLQTRCDLVRELTDDCRVEEGLDLNSPREIELLRLGLGSLVPFLQDLGKCRSIYVNELLQLVEVVCKLLEALLKGCKLG